MIFSMPDRGDMQFRHIRREIGVAFVGADDKGAGFGDREIAAGHAGVGREDQWTRRLALRFGQIMNVAVSGIGADRLSEHLGDVRSELVHRGHDDMTRVFIVELLNALAQIGLDHFNAH